MEIHCEASLLATLEARARAAAPAEACGLLAGVRDRHGWRLTEFIELDNRSTELGKFSMDPIAVLRVESRIRAEGQLLCGCFHSHPGGKVALSASDLSCAWPELIQLVCTADIPRVAEHAAWQVRDGRAQRLAILTVPA